ncbi:MAG: CPXCG motif-containing cysteine-rich protein [Bacteroidota bacterium]
MYEIEHAFYCPYCLAPITMLLDPSVGQQTYVEDCEVCCSPIEVTYAVADETVHAFEAERMD